MTEPASSTPLRLRAAARAILLDPDDRVLLVRFRLPNGSIWALPGGGLEPGESHRHAAHREVAEETGLPHDELIGPVWIRTAVFSLPGFDHDGQREEYFVARATGTVIAPSMTAAELEAERLAGAAWWSVDDILASTEAFAPRAMGPLLAALLVDGPPPEPLLIGN